MAEAEAMEVEPQQHQQHAELAHQDLSQEERWAQQAPEPWQGLPPMPEPSLPPPPEQLPPQQLSSQGQPPSEQPQPSWQPQQPQSSVAPPQQQQQPALQQQPSLPQSQAQPASAAAPLAAAGYEPAPHRSKKGRRGWRSGSEPRDLVHLSGPIPRDSERLATGWRPVRLSDEEKAAQVVLDDSRLGASFSKGYRMVRATHGAHEGTWYYEVHIEELGTSGAARVGWATRHAELQAPVGHDAYGYSYRSKEGSKVSEAWRDGYGEAYGEGDVIGCLIHLPPGGGVWEKTLEDVKEYKRRPYYANSDDEEKEPPPDTPQLPGSLVAFTRNGKLQGIAYSPLREGTYYPALSLFTDARKFDTAKVRVNFGETEFAHPPPQLEAVPPARPVCDIPGPRPEGWTEEQAQQEGSP